MALEFGTSRTPLREALRMLRTEGLVQDQAHNRVKIAPMSPRDFEELCVLRVTLEAEAIRLSVPRMTSEDFAELEGHLAEMSHYEQTRDFVRWSVPHFKFHRCLTAPAGERMHAVLTQMFDHAERYRRLHAGYRPTAWATADHRAILSACEAADVERSASELASHIARIGFEMTVLLDASYAPDMLKLAVLDAGGWTPVNDPDPDPHPDGGESDVQLGSGPELSLQGRTVQC